ncbi:hypothetical protein [Salinirubrum litoreum]|uniref:Uncharacterized protein n=1 Tax=Salinirubrum litoreum TaxID=1126234 RepID=A0ABD5RGB9_9EURY|nr:hypothetical protein [Salinirubrum litoreum]
MNRPRLLAVALGGGIVLTLLSGLVPVRTLAGGVHYGLPMAWLVRRILAPEFFPWRVNWLGLVVDIVVWTVILALLLVVSERLRNRQARSGPTE